MLIRRDGRNVMVGTDRDAIYPPEGAVFSPASGAAAGGMDLDAGDPRVRLGPLPPRSSRSAAALRPGGFHQLSLSR